jgi:hypothetical protein
VTVAALGYVRTHMLPMLRQIWVEPLALLWSVGSEYIKLCAKLYPAVAARGAT